MNKCPDCQVEIGQLHIGSCDWETCPDCGGQRLTCSAFGRHYDYPKIPWGGERVGHDVLVENDDYAKFVNGKWVKCSGKDPDSEMPDYNALYIDYKWCPEKPTL